jgi:enoyl-CoA hydratase/carnithine racemase
MEAYMSELVRYEQIDSVAVLTIDNPKANLLNGPVLEKLRVMLDMISINNDIRAVVITGEGGKIFSGGADLSAGFGDLSPADSMKRGQDLNNKIDFFDRPVIAAVNGHALGGGCEIALACHFRFIKRSATIGLTESNIGIIPGYGGTLRMLHLLGRSRCLEYIIFGKKLDAEQALSAGLVDRICDDPVMEAVKFGNELAARPRLTVKAMLKIVSSSPHVSANEHLRIEREEIAKLIGTPDMIEGLRAFAEKRKPEFNKK